MEIRISELSDGFMALGEMVLQYCKRHNPDIDINGINPVQSDPPYEWESHRDPNARRSDKIAKYNDGELYFSTLSNQMIWYIAWLGYQIKENNLDKDKINSFISRLIDVDKGENLEASYKEFEDWNSEELDSIFLYATWFIFCHEIGHTALQHPNYRKGREIEARENELRADSFAAGCILEISNHNELAKYGILVAQLAIRFIRDKKLSTDYHPDPDKRLENIRNHFDFTERMPVFIRKAKKLSKKYLKKRFKSIIVIYIERLCRKYTGFHR
jgi:hypothetical protein